jgi:hypothetical protein
MNTISSKVNPKELEAITEFANLCGETTSNLIRKVVLNYATFQGGFEGTNAYEIKFVQGDYSDKEFEKHLEQNINHIRKILDIPQIII